MVALKFFATADDKKLPAGTYPINNTKTANTVMASEGCTEQGLTYSFAVETDDQGSIAASWWIVSGEVIVAADGSITVNAVNSYDKTVTIAITFSATALFDVNANENMSKFFRNGQLYIRKGDKIYNALGTEVE